MLKRKKKNRGETLIESIMSLMILSISMLPINNSMMKIYETHKKINLKQYDKNYKKNIIEIIKSLDYNLIDGLAGKYSVGKLKDLEQILGNISFDFDDYSFSEKIEISVTKLNSFYIDKNKEIKYIYLIKVGDMEDYYYPNL